MGCVPTRVPALNPGGAAREEQDRPCTNLGGTFPYSARPEPAVTRRLGRRGAGVSGHGAIMLLPLARAEPPQPPSAGVRTGKQRRRGHGVVCPLLQQEIYLDGCPMS